MGDPSSGALGPPYRMTPGTQRIQRSDGESRHIWHCSLGAMRLSITLPPTFYRKQEAWKIALWGLVPAGG
jgi:hypothetical protein